VKQKLGCAMLCVPVALIAAAFVAKEGLVGTLVFVGGTAALIAWIIAGATLVWGEDA
jgi:hypothetical protein